MTLKDVKEELISILTEIEITSGSMVTSIYKDELKMAIEIMRKYQKIEEIYERFQKGYDYHMAWLDVMEVLEDGNDD